MKTHFLPWLAATAWFMAPHTPVCQAGAPWFERALVGMEVGPTGAQFGHSDTNDTRYRAKFDYAAPLSEMVLMGNLAVRFPNQQLLWDGEAMQVKNQQEANDFVRRKYREGWSL